MTDGDDFADEVRRLAGERSFIARRFLMALDRGEYADVKLSTVPAAERDILLPALRAMTQQCSGKVRLNAGRALLELGDPAGSDAVVEALIAQDRQLRA